MTVSAYKAARPQRLVLYDVTWKNYVHMLRELQGRHLRITYDRGALEIMTLSFMHERLSGLVALLLHVLALEFGMPVLNAGSTTLKRRKVQRGLEPDKCFYLQNEPLVRNKTKLDLRTDPPPDLAIEIDISRSSLSRHGIYAKLRVPELWSFDGKALVVFRLNAAGEYEESTQSGAFPRLPLDGFVGFLLRAGTTDDTTLMREFQEWVRQWR